MAKLSKRTTKKQLKKRMLAEQKAACDASKEPLSTSDGDMDLDAPESVKEADATEKKSKPQSMDDFLETFGEGVDVEDEDDLDNDLANGTSSNDEEHESGNNDDDAEFDLEKVKETDPEFYQYMIKNDPSFANSSSIVLLFQLLESCFKRSLSFFKNTSLCLVHLLFPPFILFCSLKCACFRLSFLFISSVYYSLSLPENNDSEEHSSESFPDDGADEKRSVSEELVEKLEEEILSKVLYFSTTFSFTQK